MLTPPKFHHQPIATALIATILGFTAIGCSQAVSSRTTPPNPAQSKTEAPRSAESIVKAQPDRPTATNNPSTQIANTAPETKSNEIMKGRYWVGATDQGLEVDGERYRYDDENGVTAWQPLSELTAITAGVVFDGDTYWCLSSMAPKSGATACAETGWVKPITGTPAPVANRSALFTCSTENGKEIQLFETENTIDYSFGRPGETPELELQVPRDQASTWQWHGIGRWMSYSVSVPNGDTTYTVFSGTDKLSPRKESGVRVERNGETLTTVDCSNITTNNLRGVQLKKSDI